MALLRVSIRIGLLSGLRLRLGPIRQLIYLVLLLRPRRLLLLCSVMQYRLAGGSGELTRRIAIGDIGSAFSAGQLDIAEGVDARVE
jgi:hypothetical protein